MKLPAFRASSLALAASLLATSGLLAGCEGGMVGTAPSGTTLSPIGAIHGTVHGGRQPVVGAAVYVYQAGTTGYGSASTSLLTNYTTGNYPTTPDTNGNYYVTTDSNGFFGLSGEYTCTVGDQVYLYAVGGNTGGGVGTTNPAAGFIAALGQCPSSGSMASVTPSVNMNEASTIAAAYALAGFAVDALHIGIPTSTTPALATLEQTNLANAFATAKNIYNVGTAGVVSSFATYTTGTGTQSPASTITAYSISGGVATFTCANSYAAGQTLILSGFPTSTFLNNQGVTVLSTGLSSTQFQANVTGSTASITKYANSTTVATFTSANTFFTGENLILSGFPSTAPNSTVPYNGATVTVISTGLSTTKFEANYPVASTVSTTTLTTAALATMVTSTITESGVATVPTGTLPTTKLNALANSLAACVNSTGSASTACTDVLQGSTTDTASAAIYIAKNPVTAVSTIFSAAPATGNPYNSALTASPTDWTMSIIYSGGGLSTPANVAPHALAIDAAGNIWAAEQASNRIAAFSNQGTPLTGAPFTGNGLNTALSVAVDSTSANVWVTNNGGSTLSEFTTAGAPVSGSPFTIYSAGTTNALNAPSDTEIDGAGNLWTSNYAGASLVNSTPTGGFLAIATNTTYLSGAESVSIEPGATNGTAGLVWVTSATDSFATTWSTADVLNSHTATSLVGFASVIDSSGNLWMEESGTNVTKVTLAGVATNYPTKGSNHSTPQYYAVAIDGANNVYLPDLANGTIEVVNSSGALISGLYGYAAQGNTNYTTTGAHSGSVEPIFIITDGSGNIWYQCLSDATLREVVGAAVPVVTPLSYAVANNLLGQMP